jgi:hypothetical protein
MLELKVRLFLLQIVGFLAILAFVIFGLTLFMAIWVVGVPLVILLGIAFGLCRLANRIDPTTRWR